MPEEKSATLHTYQTYREPHVSHVAEVVNDQLIEQFYAVHKTTSRETITVVLTSHVTDTPVLCRLTGFNESSHLS